MFVCKILTSLQLPLVNSLVKLGLSGSLKQTVVEHDGFVSVYDKRITFKNIQTIAQRLSAIIHCRIFFSAVYDDDVFEFGLCVNGEIVSLHISGECEAYGRAHVQHNIEDLQNFVSNGGENTLCLQDLYGADMEGTLIKAFGFQFDKNC